MANFSSDFASMANCSSSPDPPSTTSDLSSSMDESGSCGIVSAESGQDSTRSLVEALKSPTPASIGRKRAVGTNYPPTGKKRCQGTSASDPKKITPAQRAHEFKDENLIVSQNKLFL